MIETHMRYRIDRIRERAVVTGTLAITKDEDGQKLPSAGEVLTVQTSELSGVFKVVAIYGPFTTGVDKESYTVELLAL